MWNHRVLLKKYDDILGQNDQYELNIHEVYYNNDGTPNAYTKNPITVSGLDPNSIKWTINRISDSLKKPILWEGEKFPQEVKVTYTCLLCGRNKFTKKTPHNCSKNYRKRNIQWETKYE
jgi:hypothetical protein